MADNLLVRSLEVSRVFTPTAPVDERALFAGRTDQLKKIVDAVNQKGQHAVIYGERGVGKTSLANVLASFLPAFGHRHAVTPRINCDSSDTFESLFDKALREFELVRNTRGFGFAADAKIEAVQIRDLVGGDFSPDNVRRALAILSQHFIPVLIFDEFDRLTDAVKHSVADTIKSLSDHGVDATIVVVGVADTVVELIREHASVERAVVQIPMPRMSNGEISEIITRGVQRLNLGVDTTALSHICLLSQGLPHYAHLIGLYAARNSIENARNVLDTSSVSTAIEAAVSNSQHSIQTLYHTATMSPRKDNLFADVLLSCAMAPVDQMGYFAAQDVRGPMREITGKDYDIPSFSQHLKEFTEDKRGPILKKIGTPRRYRFRFINPLLQPYIVMQGCQTGKLLLK